MKKILMSLLLAFTLINLKAQSMRDLKTATAFIYVQNGNTYNPYGTCFFVGIKSPSLAGSSYVYLVTAKHVLQNKQGQFLNKIFVRTNRKDSTSSVEPVQLITTGISKNVFVSDNQSIDLAVIPLNVNLNVSALGILDETFLSNRQEFQSLSIREGTEVFFTGLFTGYAGNKQIYPIVRFGKVALIPSEKIFFTGQFRELILIESNSYGGNSGAPVYFNVIFPNGQSILKLGGILNGTFRDIAEVVGEAGRDVPLATLSNNGISGITPIYLLVDILNRPELKILRK